MNDSKVTPFATRTSEET